LVTGRALTNDELLAETDKVRDWAMTLG